MGKLVNLEDIVCSKKLCKWCKIVDDNVVKIISYVFDEAWEIEIAEKWCFVEFLWFSWNISYDYLVENCGILWHMSVQQKKYYSSWWDSNKVYREKEWKFYIWIW